MIPLGQFQQIFGARRQINMTVKPRDVAQIADVFEQLCVDAGLRAATSTRDVGMSVAEIATTMNAIENQPMLHNNAREVNDDDRSMLAGRIVDVWHGLRP